MDWLCRRVLQATCVIRAPTQLLLSPMTAQFCRFAIVQVWKQTACSKCHTALRSSAGDLQHAAAMEYKWVLLPAVQML